MILFKMYLHREIEESTIEKVKSFQNKVEQVGVENANINQCRI